MQAYMKQLANLKKQTFCIEVEVLNDGTLPAKAHRTDAGFDLYATEDIHIEPGQVIKTPLNIKIKFPTGAWGRIETKSGLGSKGMLVFAGVIDEGYRGIPHSICTNLSSEGCITILKGQKIAQMTMNPHSNEYYIEQVETVDTATERADGGFGSSGK